MRAAAVIVFQVLILLMPGCVPLLGFVVTYDRVEAPTDPPEYRQGATETSGRCPGVPVGSNFPFNGVYLSAMISGYGVIWIQENYENRKLLFGIYIPEGHQAHLLGKEVTVLFKNDNIMDSVVIFLKPKMNKSGDDYFGVLNGHTDTSKINETLHSDRMLRHTSPYWAYKSYWFSADFGSLPHEGNIALPSIQIDGKTYEGPILPFRDSIGMIPFNC